MHVETEVVEHDSQLTLRIPSSVHDALRDYARRLSEELGVKVTPSVAARRLLIIALDAEGVDLGEHKPAKPRKR